MWVYNNYKEEDFIKVNIQMMFKYKIYLDDI